jgi:putative oxidoreductase
MIMLQTLYFKFTGAEESVYIFTQVGMEPWGRIGVGVMELIASVLIILPATSLMVLFTNMHTKRFANLLLHN